MKVLVVNDHFHAVGGAESYTLNLCSHLLKRGVEVLSAGSSDGRGAENLPWHHTFIDPYPLDFRFALSRLWSIRAGRAIKKLVVSEEPDVVHFNSVFSRLSTAALRGAAGRVPTVMTVHDCRFECSQGKLAKGMVPCPPERKYSFACAAGGCVSPWMFAYQKLRNYAARANMPLVDALVAPSTFMKDLLDSSLGVGAEYVPHGISLEGYARTPPPQNRRVLYAGRLMLNKGLGCLIEAVSSMHGVGLLVAGAGPDEQALKDKAAGVEGMGFLGQQFPRELKELYRSSDIVCVPSLIPENSPMVVYEAMASARPVVASKVGGIPDLVEDGVTGLLVPPGDPAALADALNNLLLDPGRLNEMSHAARLRAEERYGMDTHIDNILSLYDEARKRFKQR